MIDIFTCGFRGSQIPSDFLKWLLNQLAASSTLIPDLRTQNVVDLSSLVGRLPLTFYNEGVMERLVTKQLSINESSLTISQRAQMLRTHLDLGVYSEPLIAQWLQSRYSELESI